MSVTIRLAKIGKRHAPAYRLVVSTTRNKRNGKFLDILGNYNPSDKKADFTYDKNKFNDWVSKGAMTTKAVDDLVSGTYKYVKYEPKKTEKDPEETEKTDVKPVPDEKQKKPEVKEPEKENKDSQASEAKKKIFL